jgi:hypothetical protein
MALGLLAGAAACGISAVGTMPPGEEQTLPDGGKLDGRAPDASGCRSITTNTPGSLVAPKVGAAKTVDGDLSDWDSCFVALDRNSAYATRDLAGGGFVSGEFSIVHDGAKIYVAVRIVGIAPLGGSNPPALFANDSAEIYLDGDGATQQAYGPDTTQIIVDHAGRRQGFRDSTAIDTPGANAAARVAPDGLTFTIELEITPQTISRTSFANVMGFDVALNNGSGSAQQTQIIWFQECRQSSGCGCADGNDAPYCDARQFGSLMLAP